MQIDVQYSLVSENHGRFNEFWMYKWIRRLALITAHVAALGFTILISVLSRPGTILPVYDGGMLLFSSQESPFCFCSRKRREWLHWFLQALVVVGGVTGVGFMVVSKRVSERPHLTTWHSVLGVGTLVVTVLQTTCGLRLLFPNMSLPGPPLPRLRLYHTTCGLVTYLLAVATVMLAMFSDWFQATMRGLLWYPVALIPLLPAMVVMSQVTRVYLSKKKITV